MCGLLHNRASGFVLAGSIEVIDGYIPVMLHTAKKISSPEEKLRAKDVRPLCHFPVPKVSYPASRKHSPSVM